MGGVFNVVQGQIHRAGEVMHLVAAEFSDLTARLAELREDGGEVKARSRVDGRLIRSRDFH